MTQPTYAQLRSLQTSSASVVPETIQERILTILSVLASGQNPDGSTFNLIPGGPFVAKGPVANGNTITTDGTIPALVIRQPGTAGKVPALRIVNDDDAAAGVARQYGSTYTDEFGGFRTVHYVVISGSMSASGVIQMPNTEDAMVSIWADTGAGSAQIITRGSGSSTAHLRALRTTAERAMQIGDQGELTFYDAAGLISAPAASPVTGGNGGDSAMSLYFETVGSDKRLRVISTGGAALDVAVDGYPRYAEVTAYTGARATTNWNDFYTSTSWPLGAAFVSSGAQNAEVNYDMVLAAGTYTFGLTHLRDADRGIYTITIDGASLTSLGGSADTIDGYAASSGSVKNTIGSIVIPTSGKHTVKLKMATKNGSSYVGAIHHLGLVKTA